MTIFRFASKRNIGDDEKELTSLAERYSSSGLDRFAADASNHEITFAACAEKAISDPPALCADRVRMPRNLRKKTKNTWPKPCAFVFWSGLRGSNPPPSPWQGDALPNELNPHMK